MYSSSKLLRLANLTGLRTSATINPNWKSKSFNQGVRWASTDISGSAGVHAHGVKYFPPRHWSDVPVDVYPLLAVTAGGLTMMSIIIYIRVNKDARQLRLRPTSWEKKEIAPEWFTTA